MQCEVCHKPLNAERLACDRRTGFGDCPYQVKEVDMRQSGNNNCMGIFLILFGLFFAGLPTIAFFGILVSMRSPFVIAGVGAFLLIFIVVGVFVLFLGLFTFFGSGTALLNKETGQVWTQGKIFGVPFGQQLIEAPQPVTLHGSFENQLRYPIGVTRLFQVQQVKLRKTPSQHIIYPLLVYFLSEGVLRLYQTERTEMLLNAYKRTKTLFLFGVAEQSFIFQSQGALENELVQVLNDIPRYLPEDELMESNFYYQGQRLLSLKELLMVVYGGTDHTSPFDWLSKNLIYPDISGSGVGSVEGRLIKKVAFSPSHESSLLQENRVLDELEAWFEHQTPQVAQVFQDEIKRVIDRDVTDHSD
jgi:hypothetical protein